MTALRRLIDLPGVADLEYKALMKPGYADPDQRADYPEVDACAQAAFGITPDAAEAVERPAGLADIGRLAPRDQVDAFAAAGWDVTDGKRRPLRLLRQYALPLWLAVHGVAGQLPFVPGDDDKPTDWASRLARDAAEFRKR